VSFADGAFPIFLWAAVMLCVLLRRGPQRPSESVFGALAVGLLADLTWIVALRPHTPLSSPWGLALQRLAGPLAASPSPLRLAVGAALFVAAMLAARRAALRPDEPAQVARARALGVATLLGVAAFVVAALTHRLDALSRLLATIAHPIWLALWGFAWGAAGVVEGRRAAQQLGLFLLSALFYQSWAATMPGAYRFLLGLIVATIVLDYWLARLIEARADEGPRRAMLVASLVANLGILGVFKYADFLGENLFTLARLLGRRAEWSTWNLVLPAGISFHTFQSLSYTVDVYRRRLRPTASLLEFATFVLFFPQLVAGPIVRADEFLPQIAAPPAVDEARALAGLWRIALGLAKKLWLADTLALTLTDRVFAHPEQFSALENLLGVYGYAFQIYLDFSAYSDIAVGAAALLGFTLPENFRAPYRSGDLAAFWRRWHISLSSWLRDYLYIPLGGSRDGEARTYRNLALTMLLGGLWHGAAWTFVVWGLLHGGGLAVTRAVQRRWDRSPAARPARDLAAFTLAALVAGALHLALRGPLSSLATALRLDVAWLHLGLAWLWLAPLWAAVGAFALRAGRRRAAALATFHYVAFAWVFFRAPRFADARAVLGQLATLTGDTANVPRAFVVALAVAALAHLAPERPQALVREAFVRAPWWLRAALLVAAGLALRALARPAVVPFIYFQF
jgi:D-alanyl-lipoteichoic acid acyltransferase DltB (MBOAT superfamily)